MDHSRKQWHPFFDSLFRFGAIVSVRGWGDMKIGERRPKIRPVSVVSEGQGSGPGVRTAEDIATRLGLSDADLTPRLRDALMPLLDEVERLRSRIGVAERRIKEAEELADRDPLLPVLNRRAFMRELARSAAYARRYREPTGLAYFDIDNFKQVNDSYGHVVGDAALTHLAGVIVANIRETDVVGRLGGDEFGVILARADEQTAHLKAEALSLLISLHPLVMNGTEIPLSISVGAISFSGDETPQDALTRADEAMYRAKREPQ